MQNQIPSHAINNNPNGYATIGYLEERRIKYHVDSIAANAVCRVTDISPNANCVEHEYSGKYLKEHLGEILGALSHGFIVKSHGKNGEDRIIFVYTGPIPRVVEKILHTIH